MGQNDSNQNQNLNFPKTAMVLAAGLGMRMRPITESTPKPLIKVSGKTLLDYGLDALSAVGVSKAVVNVHHLAAQIENHVAGRTAPQVIISDERETLMNSGGGVVKALPQLGRDPFFILNADSFWIEGYQPNLDRMIDSWDGDTMDILLLLSSMNSAVGYDAPGDYMMEPDGRLERRGDNPTAPFAYAGAAIVNPQIFEDPPNGAFGLVEIFDRAMAAGRLFGMRMDGLWLHVGTPQAIKDAEKAIARSAA